MFDDDREDAVTLRVLAGGSLLDALLSVVLGLQQDEGDLSLMWVIRDQRSCMQSHDLYPVTAATPPRGGSGGGALLDAEMFDEYVIGAADRMKVSESSALFCGDD